MKEIGIGRQRFTIKICDREFSLSFIPNWARFRFIEFWDKIRKMLDAQTIKDDKKRQEMIDSLGDDSESDLLYEMIQVILEANGEAFDKDWWERHTDAENQLEFVRMCIECADGDKKKALAVLGA